MRLLLVVLAIGSLGLFSTPGCASSPRSDRSPAGRELALPVVDLQGDPRIITGSPGKVTVVIVWATWCHPCESALVFADELSRVDPSTIDVVALSVDADPRLLAAHSAHSLGGVRLLWDPEGATASRRLGVDRLPTVLVVDQEDRIRSVFVGWERGYERALSRAVETFRPPDPCPDETPGTD